jgi:hypothetical protein
MELGYHCHGIKKLITELGVFRTKSLLKRRSGSSWILHTYVVQNSGVITETSYFVSFEIHYIKHRKI